MVTAYLLAVTIVTPLYGKLGDLYGRKLVLQAALVIFLIGSVLCGLAQGMTELIAFRAIQGLGRRRADGERAGGGRRRRARRASAGSYTGLFGAVFGVSSVAGPLIGGFFTTHLSLALDLLHQPPARRRSRSGALAVALPSASRSACSTRSTTRARCCWRSG